MEKFICIARQYWNECDKHCVIMVKRDNIQKCKYLVMKEYKCGDCIHPIPSIYQGEPALCEVRKENKCGNEEICDMFVEDRRT